MSGQVYLESGQRLVHERAASKSLQVVRVLQPLDVALSWTMRKCVLAREGLTYQLYPKPERSASNGAISIFVVIYPHERRVWLVVESSLHAPELIPLTVKLLLDVGNSGAS